jgi:gliding motility-associated-like protein/uncharacterized repeat protein (TIGR01451 family)
VTVECSDAEALATAQAAFPIATDACDADVTNIEKTSGDFVASEGCANAGTYTNTWTVTDDCGNVSDVFTQVITIEDTTSPTWSTMANALNVTVECSDAEALATAQAAFPIATDACDADVINIEKTSGDFVASEGCANAGTYTNIWTVTDDCGNISDIFTQVITIEDTTVPTITCPTDQTIASDSGCKALVPNFIQSVQASDNCTSTESLMITQFPEAGTEVGTGITEITVTVKDVCGNENQCKFNLVVTKYIDAKDDIISNINGISGNPNAGNVLNDNGSGNDFLNCSNALIEDVNITILTAATSIGINNPIPEVNTTSGQISIPEGTPGGTYIIVYQICEKLNPTNCDSATVTITVSVPEIVAKDDSIIIENGIIGDTNAGNVLNDNSNGSDTLNGENVVIDDVNLTVVTPAIPMEEGTPVPEIDITTGQISIPAGTPDGTYMVVYQICEKLNPTNCDDAVVTITVHVPSIAITKDGVYEDTNQDGITNIGDKIKYTFVVTNNGTTTLTDIIINDEIMSNLEITGGSVTLDIGASTSFEAIYSITQDDIDAGVVYNWAKVTGTPPVGPNVDDWSTDPTVCENCPPKEGCPDCTITELPQNPGLNVVKTATVSSNGIEDADVYSFVGDIINYIIHVENTGNVTLHDIVVKDPLTGLDTTNESFNLNPGEYKDFPQSYTITLADLSGDSKTNIATADGLTSNNTPIHATDTLTVEKAGVLGCGTIVVHNAFSPNGDGINEKFVIDNIIDTTCYPENTVEIYNRWGILVYETKNYDNESNAFDGYSHGRTTVSKSSGLPTGTYFYILNYTSVDLQGKLTTNRKDGYLYLTR